jgi:cell fate regulator YaaT (PSP1 superfamily)
MSHVVRVEFADPARSQYCQAGQTPVRPGDVVVVETEWGVGMAAVGAILPEATLQCLKPPVRPILRRATATDLSRRAALVQREDEARVFCRERIAARQLPMKLTEVRIGLDSSKAMFYFTADGRVDFRELVKDLIQHLRTRVELRQIGVRDEAKVLGSAGACGRATCCRAFLQGFAPVSIRMAKDQNLALNPGKLSGICGRLKCCLGFEHAQYAELKRGLPKPGAHVMSSRGPGVVRGQNILEQSILVNLETGGQVTLGAGDVTVRPRPEPPARPAKPKDRGERTRRPKPEAAAESAPERSGNGDDLPQDLAALEEP